MFNGNELGNIISIIFTFPSVVIFGGIFIRFVGERFLPIKKADAKVIDKQKYTDRVISKNGAPYSETKYVITFLIGNKKKYFEVSKISYDGYFLNQKGLLYYRGGKILDFK